MATRTSYDIDSLRSAGQKLLNAADSLRDLASQLDAIPQGSPPHPVTDRLHDLKKDGKQMIADIGEETNDAATGLFQVAHLYQDLEQSIVNALQ
jgi:hypothetical protein